jgi:RNA polymerase sigma-70 factor, ECF subfamily
MEVAGIYAEFHQSMLAFIRSRIKSREDAEDILQNVFIKISANIHSLAEDEKLKSWIFTITRNSVIDYYRNKAQQKTTLSEGIGEGIVDLSDPDPTKGLDQCVGSLINLLPDEYRDIIIESELKGIKQKDLAEQYGVAYSSMRSKVQRGRERLKELFYNCCHIETDRRGNVLEAQGRADCGGPCKPCSGNDAAN